MHALQVGWERLSNLGVHPQLARFEKQQIRFLNQILSLAVLSTALSISISLYLDQILICCSSSTLLLVFIAGFVLLMLRKYEAAKHSVMIAMSLCLLFISLIQGMEGSAFIGLFPCMVLAYMIFKNQKARNFYYVFFSITIIGSLYLSLFRPAVVHIPYPEIQSFLAGTMSVFGLIYMLHIFQTMQHTQEEIIAQKETSLKEAQELGQIGSWEYFYETDHLVWSDQLYRLFGVEVGIPTGFDSCLCKFIAPEFQDRIRHVKENRSLIEDFECEYPLIINGMEKWFHMRVRKYRDQNQEVVKLAGIMLDITEKRLLLSQLHNQNLILEAEVARRTMSLERSNDELKRSNQDLEQFAYVASHDLQEPLRMVSNFVQLIKVELGDIPNEEVNKYVDFAVDGVRRMAALIKDLLNYSRVGKREITMQHSDLNQIVSDKLDDLSHRIAERNAKVELGSFPTVNCEPNQIGLVFSNLIHNGLKFNKHPQPLVAIKALEDPDNWIFRVQDNGIGIAPEDQEKIFDIFTRLHRKEVYEGTGIGLALCRKIIHRHGGKIWLESIKDKGTTFFFSLPKEIES